VYGYTYLACVESYVKLKTRTELPIEATSILPPELSKLSTICKHSNALEWLEAKFRLNPTSRLGIDDMTTIFAKHLMPIEARNLY
jgi:hypothetical protein